MNGDNELSKYEMNANMGQTMCLSCRSDTAVQRASEEDVNNKQATFRIVDESEEPMVSRIFARIGMEYGITATAAFAPFSGLKFNRSVFRVKVDIGSLIVVCFEVSDYMQDAPESVLEGFARSVIVTYLGSGFEFSEETLRWMNAPEFSEKHRPLYLTRNEMVGSEDGKHKSLQEALDRLVEKGLFERDPSIMIVWTKKPEADMSGRSSSIMRLVCVNKAFDSDDVPDEVVDVVLLKCLAMVRQGFTGDSEKEEAIADAIARRCPGFDRAADWLEGHRFSI